jgi:hypothetical protein
MVGVAVPRSLDKQVGLQKRNIEIFKISKYGLQIFQSCGLTHNTLRRDYSNIFG